MQSSSSKWCMEQDTDMLDDSDVDNAVPVLKLKKRAYRKEEPERTKNTSEVAVGLGQGSSHNMDNGQQLDGDECELGSYNVPSPLYDHAPSFAFEQPPVDSPIPGLGTDTVLTNEDLDDDPWADEVDIQTDSDCDVEDSYGALELEDPFFVAFDHVSEGFVWEAQLDGMYIVVLDSLDLLSLI
ncbi:hypothetical protein EWM64_g6695 [Hericium alpestre]|uniref:Uncharacterized protein n=1 Tax=Hericium alpestre TaxID=135208 RepID=A0A4Y9ZV12_9AGAM|nr:hypothetical protein EWM64_g6695 [Hericium alpestre]